MDITGSKVLLTGASGGLGEAIALELARRGARLTISARREPELADLAERTGAEVIVADLCVAADLDRVLAAARDCDVLIANAGTGGDQPIEDMTAVDVDVAIGVNLRAPILLATAFAQARMAGGHDGQIVFVGSLSGLAASPETRMYNATKFGLRGFALSLRQDLVDAGIGVTLVAPGFIRDAGMFAESGIDLPAAVRTKSPDDVAAAVVRAISDNPTEVYVAPLELRMSATLATIAPAFSAKAQRMLGVADRKPSG